MGSWSASGSYMQFTFEDICSLHMESFSTENEFIFVCILQIKSRETLTKCMNFSSLELLSVAVCSCSLLSMLLKCSFDVASLRNCARMWQVKQLILLFRLNFLFVVYNWFVRCKCRPVQTTFSSLHECRDWMTLQYSQCLSLCVIFVYLCYIYTEL